MSALKLNGSVEHTAISCSAKTSLLCSADITTLKKQLDDRDRSPLDLVAVIDRSYSMCGEMELVHSTLKFVINNLSGEDQFGIISFGSDTTTHLNLSAMTQQGKTFAFSVVDRIEVRGCTNLSAGLFAGINQLKTTSKPNNTKAVLLFTDGSANEGVCNTEQLCRQTRDLLPPGASVFCFGYGGCHAEAMLRALADEGHGLYYYVQDARDIKASFANCLGGLLSAVASQLQLRIFCRKGVELKQVLGKVTQKKIDANTYELDLGDIYSEESRNIPFQLKLAKATEPTENQPLVTLTLRYVDLIRSSPDKVEHELTINRVGGEPPKNEQPQVNTVALDEQRNRILVADALDEATKIHTGGNITGATKLLNDVVKELCLSISANSNFTQSLIADLRATIASMTGQPYHASKYMYSLARTLYTQRSSGITSASANAFVTSGQKSMTANAGLGAATSRSFFATAPDTSGWHGEGGSGGTTTTTTVKKKKKKAPAIVVDDDDDITPIQASPSSESDDGPTFATNTTTTTTTTVDPNRPPPGRQSRAIRRLMLDYKEIVENPLLTVVASPLESDLFEWHCNVSAPADSPYAGIIFHMILKFTPFYPFKPPTLYFCTYLEHPHVFGSWVCLDMLQEGVWAGTEDTPYTGWSSAYTVLSILLQLQSFLFDEAGLDTSAVAMAKDSAAQFVCPVSGHSLANPWPPFPSPEAVEEATAEYLSVFATKKIKKEAASVPKVADIGNATPEVAALVVKKLKLNSKEEFPEVGSAPVVQKAGGRSYANAMKSGTSSSATTTSTAAAPAPAPAPVPAQPAAPAGPAVFLPTPYWSADQAPRKPKVPHGFVGAVPVKQSKKQAQAQFAPKELPTIQNPHSLPAAPTVAAAAPKPAKAAPSPDGWSTVQRTSVKPGVKPVQQQQNAKKGGNNKPGQGKPAQTNNNNAKAGQQQAKAPAAPAKSAVTTTAALDSQSTSFNAFEFLNLEQNFSPAQQKKATQTNKPVQKQQPAQAPAAAQKAAAPAAQQKPAAAPVAAAKPAAPAPAAQKPTGPIPAAQKPTGPIPAAQKQQAGKQQQALTPAQRQQQKKAAAAAAAGAAAAEPAKEEAAYKPTFAALMQQEVKKGKKGPRPPTQQQQQLLAQHGIQQQRRGVTGGRNVSQKYADADKSSPLYVDLQYVLQNNPRATGLQTSLFDFFSDEILINILGNLPLVDLNSISTVCKEFCRLSGDKWLWNTLFAQRYKSVYMRDLRNLHIQNWKLLFQQENAITLHALVCFHSRTSFLEDIIGVPITVDRTNKRFPQLSSSLDLLCYDSFYNDGVRKTVWGEPFTHFLPCWINKEHGERAFPYLCESIRELTFRKDDFTPDMALTILPRLMNTMVVTMMSGCLHASLKALEGYCMFHRMLLEFVHRYPELQTKVNNMVLKFIRDDDARHKNVTPNLGEFLPLVAIATSITWDDIAIPYLEENLTRNVLWVTKKYPGLAKISPNYTVGSVDRSRLDKTIDASLVSQRLLAFHVFFYRHFARPEGVSLGEIADTYDRFYGRPSNEMKMNLQNKIFQILKITTWPQFFQAIGMVVPTQERLTHWLVQSVISSSKKGYHTEFRGGPGGKFSNKYPNSNKFNKKK